MRFKDVTIIYKNAFLDLIGIGLAYLKTPKRRRIAGKFNPLDLGILKGPATPEVPDFLKDFARNIKMPNKKATRILLGILSGGVSELTWYTLKDSVKDLKKDDYLFPVTHSGNYDLSWLHPEVIDSADEEEREVALQETKAVLDTYREMLRTGNSKTLEEYKHILNMRLQKYKASLEKEAEERRNSKQNKRGRGH